MTPKEMMRAIVSAENEAQEIYAEALAQKARFHADLELEQQLLHEKMMQRAREYVAQVQQEAKEHADDDIRLLESSLDTEMEQAKAQFEGSREQIIDKLFRIVVGLDE